MSLPISHVMKTHVVVCEEQSILKKVAELMLNEKSGSVLVQHGEDAVGMITANDMLRAILAGRDFEATVAADIMSSPLDTIDIGNDLEQAMKRFEETGRTRLVVMDGARVAGVLNRKIAERFKGVSSLVHFSDKTRSLQFRRGSGSTLS